MIRPTFHDPDGVGPPRTVSWIDQNLELWIVLRDQDSEPFIRQRRQLLLSALRFFWAVPKLLTIDDAEIKGTALFIHRLGRIVDIIEIARN